MAVEKVYKCDLCGEFCPKHEIVTLRVGLRTWRPEDYAPVDVGPNCASRPVSEVIAVAKDMPEWTEMAH